MHGPDDINGDGQSDLVVGDPKAAVAGKAGAGIIQVRYGLALASAGAATLAQGDAGVGGFPEAGDAFGSVLALGLVDADTCADVVVSAPGENLGSAADAGEVHIIFGSPTGLGLGRPPLVLYAGTAGLVGAPATNEHFGASVAVNAPHTDTEPRGLAIGIPGRDVGKAADAGAVAVLTTAADGTPSSAWTVTESSVAVPGAAEAGDRFGAAIDLGYVASGCTGTTCLDLVVGVPGEDSGAGAIVVVSNADAGSPYTGSAGLSESTAGVVGVAEAGDGFGTSLDYETDGFTGTGRVLVDSPGEDVGSVKDAGAVHLFGSPNGRLSGADSELITQDSPGVSGAAETGDHFGAKVLIVEYHTAAFYLDLIVSAPDEDLGTLKDAGTVTTFAGREPDPGKYDHAISQDTAGIPGVAAAGEHFGAGLAEVGLDYLVVGVPNDRGWKGGVVLRVPWSLLDGINSDSAVALTRAGSGTFGAALVSN